MPIVARPLLTGASYRLERAPLRVACRLVTALRPRRALELLAALSLADMRARYGRGPWQFGKWLIDPFALTGVYLLLVSVVLDRGGRATGLSLACAVVPFHLFMLTVVNALGSVRERASILANVAFPRALIPLSAACTETAAFGTSLVLIAVMMVFDGVAPTYAVLWLPLVLAVNLALAAAAAYPAALASIWVVDLRPLAVSAVRALFFLAPGLVVLDEVAGPAREWLMLNPLTGLFEAYRDVLLRGRAPAPWELLYPLAWAALIAAVFVPVFRSESRHLGKVLD